MEPKNGFDTSEKCGKEKRSKGLGFLARRQGPTCSLTASLPLRPSSSASDNTLDTRQPIFKS